MKIIKILIFLFILAFPSFTFAGKGFNISDAGITWTKKSGILYCPAGKILMDQWKNKVLTRTGIAKCYIADDEKPTIDYINNGYTSGNWTKNQSVKLTINVKDLKSKINKIFYTINGVIIKEFNNINNTNYTFTTPEIKKEGEYTIKIYAYDNAIYSSYNGAITSPNINITTLLVKIDRSAPVFSIVPNINNDEWNNNKNNIEFKIEDKYEGKNIIEKVFQCGELPNNAIRNYPVENDGTILGTCDNSSGNINCNNDNNFSPNKNNCNYLCIDDTYIKGSDGLCYKKSKILQCSSTILPKNFYYYNKNDLLNIELNSNGSYLWTSPDNIELDGTFYSYFNSENLQYSPNLNNCGYTCDAGYHKESQDCINDTKIICCGNPYLSYSTLGTKIDCTQAINQSRVECIKSSICGWDKELLGLWQKNQNDWLYITDSDGELLGNAGKEAMCGYKYFENSNGITCNPYYYLIKTNVGKPAFCDNVMIGYWSGQDNNKYLCTNYKPDNSHYTSGGNNNNCLWGCDSGYIKNLDKCIKDTTLVEGTKCDGLTCSYKYNKIIYSDKSCTEKQGDDERTSQEYNKYEDCIKDYSKEVFNICVSSGNGNYSKKISINSCK